VRPILPLDPAEIDQLQVDLVDKCGGLQRVTVPLSAHVPACQPAQVGVNERDEALQRVLVAAAPGS
jgi:hypothetical protein